MNVEQVLELAKQDLKGCLQRGEEFIPKALFFKDDEMQGVSLVPLSDQRSKDATFKALGEFCYQKGVDKVILIMDTYMRAYQTSDPSKVDKLPSDYPPSEREEALMVLSLDFRDLNKGKSLIAPYERKGTIVSFSADKMMNDNTFNGAIPACIYGGFLFGFFKKNVLNNPEGAEERVDALLGAFFKDWFHGVKDTGVEFLNSLRAVME